jgi:peptide/nickel transport system ATP-binding protein/oligopeptide transport system ATP-binding protein
MNLRNTTVSADTPKTGIQNQKNGDLLEVKDLVKYFPIKGGILQRTVAQVKAVDGVSFTVKKGETLGLVGESGCGKTTVGRTLLRLTPATSGSVIFEGKDVFTLSGNDLKGIRRDMQIIFQDPYSSLDPRMPIGESVAEGLLVHGFRDTKKRNEIVMAMLKRVGLEDYHARRYPHEFSGGQRQRIGIARAWLCGPSSSCATSQCPHSMCRSSRRCLTCSRTCSANLD